MVSPAYTSKLNDVFDRILTHGVVELPRANILLWNGNQTKVTKKLWRNFHEAWVKRCVEEWEYELDKVPKLLRAYDENARNFVIVWGGEFNEETGEYDTWLKDFDQIDDVE